VRSGGVRAVSGPKTASRSVSSASKASGAVGSVGAVLSGTVAASTCSVTSSAETVRVDTGVGLVGQV
jgi:hypothetical protein